MKTRARRRAAQPAGATRPQRAHRTLRGRGTSARVGAYSWAGLLTGAGLLLVAGCSGAPSSSSSTASGSPVNGFPSSRTFAGSGSAAAAHAPAAGTALGQPTGAQAARLVVPNQSIIFTADLTIRVRDAARAAAMAASDVAAAGGYTAAEQAQTSHVAGQRPMVSLTLKVPVAGYLAALRQLAKLGGTTSMNQKSIEVTQQVADVSSRVTSEQDAIAQLRALLKRAGSVSGLLQVQDQIASDESALEALLAQQRALAHETTYATVSVLLLGPLPHAAVHHTTSHRGFVAGLAAGWRGFEHATVWALTALGTLLPFLAVVVVLGGIGWLARRRILARHRSGPAQPTEGSAS